MNQIDPHTAMLAAQDKTIVTALDKELLRNNAAAVNLTWEPPHDCEECGHEA